MEIGALMAPRPLLMVSAAGDWTRDTPRIEFPAIQSVYKLFGAEEKVRSVQFVAPHNYNRDSREAVYGWLGGWLIGQKDELVKETSFELEQPSSMLVFFGRSLPDGAKSQQQLIEYLMKTSEGQTNALKPRDTASLAHFKEIMGSALQQAVAAQYPDPKNVWSSAPTSSKGESSQELWIGRRNEGDRVPARLWAPKSPKRNVTATLLIHPEGNAAFETTASAHGECSGEAWSSRLVRGHFQHRIRQSQSGHE